MFELVGVTRSFDGVAVVRDVSLVIERGTTTAIIGPSGCGKSTLLRLMMGLLAPDRGTIRFDGAPLDRRSRDLRRRIGYAIQSGGLFPHLTARGNVELPARHAGWSRPRMRDRIDALATLVHLPADALLRYPSELSGGQRQRVALLRSLVLDPEALLLDEPLGALDPLIRADLQHELRELFRRLQKTVVLVTHDLAEAAYLAPDDIILVREGHLIQRGPFDRLRTEPADGFVARFITAHTERVEALLGAPPHA